MLRSRSFDLLSRKFDKENDNTLPRLKGSSYGADSPSLARDRAILTDPEDTKRRRTIRLFREVVNRSWGFTLQTYGIRNKKTCEVEVMSYVDYVEMHGPAWVAGMRRGDIILSVNGDSVESTTHVELVQRIQQCRREMRLVVLFENCCKKVELHERYLKLKKLLALKMKEMKCLEEEEKLINQGVPLSRIDAMRRSTSSSVSMSSDWDAYSIINSPSVLNVTIPNQFVFRNGADSDVSSGSIAFDSSFSSDKSQPNTGQESIVSSIPDIEESKSDASDTDTKGFVQSSQSDISEASENSEDGLKHLYNITRCAIHITEACKCPEFIPDSEEKASRNDSSMTNLVDDSGAQLRSIKPPAKRSLRDNAIGIQISSSVPSLSSSPRAQRFMKKGMFYMDSDSEESVVSADAERGVAMDTGASTFMISPVVSGSSGVQNTASVSAVVEEDENDGSSDCEKSFSKETSVSPGELNNNDALDSISNSGESSEMSQVESSPYSDSSTTPNISVTTSTLNSHQQEARVDQHTTSVHEDVSADDQLSYDQSRSSDNDLSVHLANTDDSNNIKTHLQSGKDNSIQTVPSDVNQNGSQCVEREVNYDDVDHIPESRNRNSSSPASNFIKIEESKSQTADSSSTCDRSSISEDIPSVSILADTVTPNLPQPQKEFITTINVQNVVKKKNNLEQNSSSSVPKEGMKAKEPHSRNRLVHGILVNDTSQSTRL